MRFRSALKLTLWSCALFSMLGGETLALAGSCIDLSRAKYSAKNADFTTFQAPDHTRMVRVIIGLRSKIETLDIGAIIPGRVIHELRLTNSIAAEVPAASIEQIATNPQVRMIELDGHVYTLHLPQAVEYVQAPPSQETPHGITRSGAPEAWKKGLNGEGVTVAIIDTGIDATHPDLEGRVIGGKNFSSDDPERWKDGHGHGTHVSGTVAATDNDIGVIGVAPKASLLAVKVLSDYGSGSYSDVAAGVEYAVESKADVANMSLGGTGDNQTLRETMIKAHQAGLLVVAAAGNSGEDYGNPINYPAGYPEVVSTAAVDDADLRTYFSTYNKFVATAAHGWKVLSLEKNGRYARHSGTSMAAPHGAGVAALLKQAFPDDSVVELKRRLVCHSQDQWPSGRDIWTGYGIASALRSLTGGAPSTSCTYLTGPVTDPVIAPPTVKPDPSPDATTVYVKQTALAMLNSGNNRQLVVTHKLVDQNQKPLNGVEVKSRIYEGGTGPLGSASATTNSDGEVQFVLSGLRCGKYVAGVESVSAQNFSTEYGQPEAELDLGE